MAIALVNQASDFSDRNVGFVPGIAIPEGVPPGIGVFSVLRRNAGFLRRNMANGEIYAEPEIRGGDMVFENTYIKTTSSLAGIRTHAAPPNVATGHTYIVIARSGFRSPASAEEYLISTNHVGNPGEGVQLSRSGSTGLFSYRIGSTDTLNAEGSDGFGGDEFVLLVAGYRPAQNELFIASPVGGLTINARSAPTVVDEGGDVRLLSGNSSTNISRDHGMAFFGYYERGLSDAEIDSVYTALRAHMPRIGVVLA